MSNNDKLIIEWVLARNVALKDCMPYASERSLVAPHRSPVIRSRRTLRRLTTRKSDGDHWYARNIILNQNSPCSMTNRQTNFLSDLTMKDAVNKGFSNNYGISSLFLLNVRYGRWGVQKGGPWWWSALAVKDKSSEDFGALDSDTLQSYSRSTRNFLATEIADPKKVGEIS